eukprot:scaffold409717_cov45-Prasinocladus_malaysianus.AAC.1
MSDCSPPDRANCHSGDIPRGNGLRDGQVLRADDCSVRQGRPAVPARSVGALYCIVLLRPIRTMELVGSTWIFCRADVQGKIVEAVSSTGLGAGVMQRFELQRHGIYLERDAAQIRYSYGQAHIVADVVSGNIDVGMVCSLQSANAA